MIRRSSSEPTTPIERFASLILKRPLYPYQAEMANAIIESILGEHGRLISIMMARQMGKNELSAIIEAFLLAMHDDGYIIKAAPTFAPQIINSRSRLMSMLKSPYLSERIWTSWGMIGLAPRANKKLLKRHVGPAVKFFSAEPNSNVVGATASLLLEIDEAQDVDPEKFSKDFRPMASTTNATTVLYGTAWSEDTLLAQNIAANLELTEKDGIQRHFAYDWRTLAAINPNYKKFVEGEIARLGEDHPVITTQYFLQPISRAGFFLNDLQRILIQGEHPWEEERDEEGIYIAGMDVAGEDDRPPIGELVTPTRDSTIVTIARVNYGDFELPRAEVVHHLWWTGMAHTDQYAATVAILDQWGIQRLVIDKTGLGAGLASYLEKKFGDERIISFTFTRPSKSRLGYQMLSLINGGRLKIYSRYGAPRNIVEECWLQLNEARYALPAPEIINFFVPREKGHDDFLISLALCCEAMAEIMKVSEATEIIVPKRLYENEGRF